jgi:L-threonylcarbamoyladenylate synthase
MILSAQHKTNLSVFEKKILQLLLEEDQIIAFPTDTVYGLGVNAKSASAVKRLYELKKRSQEKAFILLLDSTEKVRDYIADEKFLDTPIIKKHWPGPLTCVFEVKPEVSIYYTQSPIHTIGIRVPDHSLLLDLLAFLPFPIVSTSANMSQEEPLNDALSIEQAFNHKDRKQQVACIIDGGTIIGTPSTVIQFGSDSIKVLRKGTIHTNHATLS